MSMSISASSNALSYLQQLLQAGTSGVGATNTDPLLSLDQSPVGADSSSQSQSTLPAGSGLGASSFDAGTLAALISFQGQSATGVLGQSPSDLFSQLDTDGDGQISKSEFEQALGAVGVDTQSADALFGRLDANDDGGVSQSELAKAHGHGHHHHHFDQGDSAQGSGSQQDPLSSLLSSTDITGATSQTANNADGSSTTTITYADGTTVTMTTPAASQGSSGSNGGSTDGSTGGTSDGSSNSNLIEQLIRLQSQLVTQAASALSTFA
jgi:EF hand domain-containing protein